MERLDWKRMDDITDGRPELRAELTRTAEAWLLTPSNGNERTLRRTYLILARYEGERWNGHKIIMSTPGSRGGADAVTTWLIEPDELAGVPDAGRYVVIDKSKLGRKRRELTEQEKDAIQKMRGDGMTINQIARELHLGTLRVMEYARELKRCE